jgi:hypothetical protein
MGKSLKKNKHLVAAAVMVLIVNAPPHLFTFVVFVISSSAQSYLVNMRELGAFFSPTKIHYPKIITITQPNNHVLVLIYLLFSFQT